MAHIPVSKETLAKKRLKPLSNFNFLAQQPVVEVVAGEFSSVASVYPVFFIERDGTYNPVAQPTQVLLKHDRIAHWMKNGAQPSDTVARLMRSNPAPAEAPAA